MYKPTLTTDEAARIVSIVEGILTRPKTLSWGYKLSELQGYSRIDVAHALQINIAQVYKDGRNHPAFKSEISKLVDAMDSSLVHIATTGIPDSEVQALGGNPDIHALLNLASKWSLLSMQGKVNSTPALLKEREYFENLETPSSIAAYCSKVLKPHDPEYWPKVYKHIGLDFPYQKQKAAIIDTSSKSKQAKSGCLKTILLAILICFIIILLWLVGTV